jgi:hypothetical protein
VLAPERSAALANQFLDQFLPERVPAFDILDPIEVLCLPANSSLSDVLQYLEAETNTNYSMYWRNAREESPYFGILTFTADGALILGLSPGADDQMSEAERWIEAMKEFTVSDLAYWGVEESPVGTSSEFRERAAL